jgi:hypothetical protein
MLKLNFFLTAKSEQDSDPPWFGTLDPDPLVKSWILCRVHIETNPQQYF